jgi:hypothetical protein
MPQKHIPMQSISGTSHNSDEKNPLTNKPELKMSSSLEMVAAVTDYM